MKVVFAGGGTGGHLFPAIALLEEMQRRTVVDALFVGTARGIEARVIPKMGERLELLDVQPIKGRSTTARLESLARASRATVAAARILGREKPAVVLGVGGYASGPVLVAARALGIPCGLLEQNAKPGITNRVAAKFVQRAYLTYQESASYFGECARVLGNPIRQSFLEQARRDSVRISSQVTRILVLGGSQGSLALNRDVPSQIAKAATDANSAVTVLHQCGDSATPAQLQEQYRVLGVSAKVIPFIDDVARAFRDADIVISRAGATGLAELTAIGRAAVLIPLPTAADDHQTANAMSLCKTGAAIHVAQADINPTLAATLTKLISDPERRSEMAQASMRAGKPEAARDIVDDLFAWLEVSSQSRTGTHAAASSEPNITPKGELRSWKRGEFAPTKRTRLVPLSSEENAVSDVARSHDLT